jgi:hypothetical protein
LFTLALIGALAFLAVEYFTAKGKVKQEDCTACNQQLTGVIQFLNNMKQDLSKDNPIGLMRASKMSVDLGEDITQASFQLPDTTPQNKIRISKIDSLLRTLKIDSLKKSKT